MKETLKSFGGTFLTVVASIVIIGLLIPYLPAPVRKFLPF